MATNEALERFVGRHESFCRDLATCLDVLAERFGVVRPAFAFPWGASSPELLDAVRQAGASCSVSTRCERVGPDDDVFQWGRFGVEATDTAGVLAAKLSGWYTAVATAGKAISQPISTVARTARRARPKFVPEHA